MIKGIAIIGLSVMMQACVAKPIAPASSSQQSTQSPNRFSITEIKKKEEAKYAQKLIELNAKDAAKEVKKAQENNTLHLLIYYTGKGGPMKIPGLTETQFKNHKCEIISLEGMGDSIYGENHFRFRLAQEQYASEFNTLMLPFCQ